MDRNLLIAFVLSFLVLYTWSSWQESMRPPEPPAGIEQLAEGKFLGDVGNAVQQHVEKNRYSVVREYCGHGIGRVFHEDPQVLHYGKPGSGMELRAGMTLTVEPMVNAGKRNVRLLPDGWTVVTKDHSLSAQWEHTILVTEQGYEVLTKRSDEIF